MIHATVKQVLYKPEEVDAETGEVKKEAQYSVNFNIPLTPEVVEVIQEMMLTRSAGVQLAIEVNQGTLPGIVSQVA